jgi:hypothetical protein
MEKEEGWSSEGSDGGVPVALFPSSASKGKKGNQNNAGKGKYSEGPWRSKEHRDQIGGQRQSWEDKPEDAAPAGPWKSSLSEHAAPENPLESFLPKHAAHPLKSPLPENAALAQPSKFPLSEHAAPARPKSSRSNNAPPNTATLEDFLKNTTVSDDKSTKNGGKWAKSNHST